MRKKFEINASKLVQQLKEAGKDKQLAAIRKAQLKIMSEES